LTASVILQAIPRKTLADKPPVAPDTRVKGSEKDHTSNPPKLSWTQMREGPPAPVDFAGASVHNAKF
jgi:hypothetical protein